MPVHDTPTAISMYFQRYRTTWPPPCTSDSVPFLDLCHAKPPPHPKPSINLCSLAVLSCGRPTFFFTFCVLLRSVYQTGFVCFFLALTMWHQKCESGKDTRLLRSTYFKYLGWWVYFTGFRGLAHSTIERLILIYYFYNIYCST